MLPEVLTRCMAQHAERQEQRRNFLHPDTAAGSFAPTPASGGAGGGATGLLGGAVGIGGSTSSAATSFQGFASIGASGSIIGPNSSTMQQPLVNVTGSSGGTTSLLPHSRSVPSGPGTVTLHPWPASPVLPPVSSRTPHLVPETGTGRSGMSSTTSQQQQQQQSGGSQSASRLPSGQQSSGIGGLGTSQGSDTTPHS